MAMPPPPPGFTVRQPQPAPEPMVIEGPPDVRGNAADARAEAAAARAAAEEARAARRFADEQHDRELYGPPGARSRRQLPNQAIDRLDTGTSLSMALDNAVRGFNDNFAGNTVTGGVENEIQRRFSSFGTPGQQDWWASVESMDNVIRNSLFGSALTATEKAAWERTTVSPSMDPAQVRTNLTRRREVARGALRRLARTYRANGYNEDAIRESLGELDSLLDDTPDTPGAEQDQQTPPPPALPETPPQPPGADPSPYGLSNVHFGETDEEAAARFEREAQENGQVLIGRSPEGAPLYGPPPGRGAGAERNGMMLENQLWSSTPFVGPLSQAARGVLGEEGANAAIRGVTDTATLGTADELRAAAAGITGGDYEQELARQRATDTFDQENNFGARLTGQFAGGAVLPASRVASLPRLMAEGAALGGAYGFGSGQGDLADRGQSALIGAGIGGAVPLALRGAGGVVNALNPWAAPRSAATRELIEAAARQEVPLIRADAGGVGTRMATGVVARTPGGIPLAAGADRSIDAAAAARNRIAGNIGQVRDETGAGQAAQRGMREFLETSSARESQLFRRVPIKPDHPMVLDGTRDALRERTAGMASNPELSEMFRDPRLEGYLSALESGGLSWADARRFRSLIGEMIEQPTVAAEGTSGKALRRIYGALSQDLEATAGAISPRALTMVRRANQYSRGRHARREGIIADILGPNFDESAQSAFEQINRWAARRGGNFAAVGQALRSMPADEANSVRASLFARLGRATAGRQDETGEAFSPAQFATDWANLNPRARQFLAPEASHRDALNDLVRITNGQKRAGAYNNFSNTSLGTNAVAFFGGLQFAPISTIVAALGSLAAGRFLASPPSARWIATAARTRNPRLVIQGLTTIARRNPAIAQDALGLQRMLQGVANDNALPIAGRAAASPDEGPGDADQ